jgi:hypothetical protein
MASLFCLVFVVFVVRSSGSGVIGAAVGFTSSPTSCILVDAGFSRAQEPGAARERKLPPIYDALRCACSQSVFDDAIDENAPC